MIHSIVKTPEGFEPISYRRRIETLGPNDAPLIAEGPNGERDNVWYVGEAAGRPLQYLTHKKWLWRAYGHRT